jgi:hypothetical protein
VAVFAFGDDITVSGGQTAHDGNRQEQAFHERILAFTTGREPPWPYGF